MPEALCLTRAASTPTPRMPLERQNGVLLPSLQTLAWHEAAAIGCLSAPLEVWIPLQLP
jgi:hypothetical protein